MTTTTDLYFIRIANSDIKSLLKLDRGELLVLDQVLLEFGVVVDVQPPQHLLALLAVR